MAHKTSLKLLFLFIITIFFSCTKEVDLQFQEEALKSSLNTNIYLQNEVVFELSPHYESANNALQNLLNTSRNETGISVVTDTALYIEIDEGFAYTFKLFREEPTLYIENVVLSYSYDTEEYSEYLVQYDVTAQEFIAIYNGEPISNSGVINVISLENGFIQQHASSNRGCATVCNTIFVECFSGDHHGGNVGSWGGCLYAGTSDGPSAYQSCTTDCGQTYTITPDGGNGSNGGGGSTAVATNPYSPEPCEPGSNMVGFVDPDGNCIVITPDPCIQLNAYAQSQPFKNLIAALNTPANLNSNVEKGYELSIDENGTMSASLLTGSTTSPTIPITVPENGTMVGYIHTHYDGLTNMFTPEDIRTLSEIFYWRAFRNKSMDELIAIVISQDGVYAMMIEDFAQLESYVVELATPSEFYKEDTGFKERTNKPFLNQDFTYNEIINIFTDKITPNLGLGIYKASNDLSTWSKVTPSTNPQNNPTLTPCN
jgi:hypothetical protein